MNANDGRLFLVRSLTEDQNNNNQYTVCILVVYSPEGEKGSMFSMEKLYKLYITLFSDTDLHMRKKLRFSSNPLLHIADCKRPYTIRKGEMLVTSIFSISHTISTLSKIYYYYMIIEPGLTHYQTTNFRLFRTDNFKFDENGRKLSKQLENAVGKHLWEKEKLLVPSNFSFSHSVFKRFVSQRRQKVSLCGNGLNCHLQILQVFIHPSKTGRIIGSPAASRLSGGVQFFVQSISPKLYYLRL